MTDIEDIVIVNKHKDDLPQEQWSILIDEFKISNIKNSEDLQKFRKYIQRQYKFVISNCHLIKVYNHLNLNDINLKNIITKKKCKSNSGVLVITVLTAAHPEYVDENGEIKKAKFSCKHDCAYCPNEVAHEGNNWVDQPRSYLFSEPAVLRANDNDFDAIKQMNARISTLIEMGHIPDKLEVIVLGGTWTEYPRHYQDRFVTELYYAANTFNYIDKREMLSLEEEITINETSDIHIIGLTLETRPDTITMEEIKHFRRYNCTRIQLGVQHTNNEVLKKINRGHDIECVYKAIKMLKNNCYKIDIHLMPNLPGASYEIDKEMLDASLYDERLQVDQYKIYPTAIVPWTKIKKWYEEGSYIPYDDEKLYTLIRDFKMKVQKYKRLNRIIRDIPSNYITGGYTAKSINMRQLLQNDQKINNWKCRCIRCREVGIKKINHEDVKLMVEKYKGSGSDEYYISYETDEYLVGFIRLRINNDTDDKDNSEILPVLKDAALIRELHVYSNLSDVGNNLEQSMQHKGYGKKLIKEAERIALENKKYKIAIISGTGVRNYYKKLGYNLCDTYMVKHFNYFKEVFKNLISYVY
jgi:ELP3 family radical SAM enzyme/protein acetyltransferase